MERKSGEYLTSSTGGETYQAYIPAPLPPDPPLDLSGALLRELEKANYSLGKLDTMAEVFPDINLFLYQYIRKEALLSSQIEGTQSSFSDLLLYEIDQLPGVPLDDTEEVSNYIAALNHGLQRLQTGFPLSLRLLKEIHSILLRGSRGKNKQPGEFRQSQNWIGGSRPGNAVFVPPPPGRLMDCLGQLEIFLHTDSHEMPTLIKAGLSHIQFETIHPFLDGNGRLGRLLITLLLCHDQTLKQPLLYLSLYFKQHRADYYTYHQKVRQSGDWETWLMFFLRGVIETAEQAIVAANNISKLFNKDREVINNLGRIAKSCQHVYAHLQENGIIAIKSTSQKTGINRTTVNNCLALLLENGIVEELTGYKRNRLFVYKKYIQILADSTDPIK